MRKLTDPKIVVASHNEGKVREIRALLAPYGIETVSAAELGLDEPDETETTFQGNALIKAHAAAKASGLPALADDSGIAIDALDGAPGVYTADWAETPNGRDFMMAMERAWSEVQASAKPAPHRAAFYACLAIAWPDGQEQTFLGRADGTLTWPPRGDQGFGYDPMFVPDAGDGRTFGEMPYAEKEPLSHRSDAFTKFKTCLEDPA
ncbi:MAG: RdgB/HAM1 family non-canonical purine NTP pyrophosphatase [Pseudomonadota bacterium]